MEPLSSFAINIAAGIVLNKLFPSDLNVDKGIRKAFEQATNDWSKNDLIRNKNLNKLIKERDQYLEELYTKKTIPEINKFSIFIEYFNKRLCENPSAYRYLNNIKDEKRHLIEIEQLKDLKKGQSEIKDNQSKILKKLIDITMSMQENKYVSNSPTIQNLNSLLQYKKTFEDLIIKNEKLINKKTKEIKNLDDLLLSAKELISEKVKEIDILKKNIMTIDESINSLKKDK